MELRIEGGCPLTGELQVPADKSILHRALMFSGMAAGPSTVTAYAPGADNRATAEVMRNLGVKVTATDRGFALESPGYTEWSPPAAPLDCGNSGTTMRLMAGVLTGAGLPSELTGDASLSQRPMGRICEPLRSMGGRVRGNVPAGSSKELGPVRVEGPGFAGGTYTSPVASAQVKSALLLAGVTGQVAVEVTEPHLSRDHTERMLRAMGVAVHSEDTAAGHRVSVPAGAQLSPVDWQVPGDISSAAFLLAAGVMIPDSSITLRRVGLNATRTGILEILEELGGNVVVEGWHEVSGEPVGDLRVAASSLVAERPGGQPTLIGGDVIPRLIDELVVIAAIAARSRGVTEIRDAAELRVKESDRVEETVRLLEAFGVRAEARPDGLRLEGPQELRPAKVDVSSDHRIALTAAVLALAAPGESVLSGFPIAEVSFPGFRTTLEALGAKVR